MKLSLRLALLERRRQLLPRLEPLFNQWKAAHIPMSVLPDDHRHHPHRDRAAPVTGTRRARDLLECACHLSDDTACFAFLPAARSPCCSLPCEPGTRRLLLDVARAADAGARQHRHQGPLPGLPHRRARRRRRQVPRSATSRSPSGSTSARASTPATEGARQAVRALPHRPQGARQGHPRLRVVRRHRPLRPQRAHLVPARGQAPDDQVQRLPQREDAVGHAHLPEGADGVRRVPQQPARRSAREHAPLRALPRRQDVAHDRRRAVRSRPRHALSAREEARAASSARPATSRRVRARRRIRRRRSRRPTRRAIRS